MLIYEIFLGGALKGHRQHKHNQPFLKNLLKRKEKKSDIVTVIEKKLPGCFVLEPRDISHQRECLHVFCLFDFLWK